MCDRKHTEGGGDKQQQTPATRQLDPITHGLKYVTTSIGEGPKIIQAIISQTQGAPGEVLCTYGCVAMSLHSASSCN